MRVYSRVGANFRLCAASDRRVLSAFTDRYFSIREDQGTLQVDSPTFDFLVLLHDVDRGDKFLDASEHENFEVDAHSSVYQPYCYFLVPPVGYKSIREVVFYEVCGNHLEDRLVLGFL